MATVTEKKQAYEQWKEHCKRVQSITDTALLANEAAADRDRRIARLQSNYAAFCEYYFPHYLTLRDKTSGNVIRTVHNAPFHNEAARKIRSTPDLKAVFMWPRGHAKSTHMDIFVPLWLMFQPKRLISFMVVVGKSEDSAVRLLGDIQAELEHNQRIIADFGKQRASASWQEGEFKAANGVKFLACGRGQSPRGLRDREARPDYIVIDDLDDDELCRNESACMTSRIGSRKRSSALLTWDADGLSWWETSSARHPYWLTSSKRKACMCLSSRPWTKTASRYGRRSGRRKRRCFTVISWGTGLGKRR